MSWFLLKNLFIFLVLVKTKFLEGASEIISSSYLILRMVKMRVRKIEIHQYN